MQLQKLSLTNFRAFKQAEFEFKPGMNLIVGINGAGKSTVLDAIRIIFSNVSPKLTSSKISPLYFEIKDIAVGQSSLFARMEFKTNGKNFACDTSKPREQFSSGTRRRIADEEFSYQIDSKARRRIRRETLKGFDQLDTFDLKPNIENAPKDLTGKDDQSLVIYFSPLRSVTAERAPSKSASAGGVVAAFAEAFSERQWRWREIGEWWLVQEELSVEKPEKRKHLNVLSKVASFFIENCKNLRVEIEKPEVKLDKDGNIVPQDDELRMLIDKGKVALDVRQLSDGERGMLSFAYPDLENPLRKGKAIVLIDELDLHLHPSWQRDIVAKLTKTFPNCQFIATTHSPQIVGEVLPESIYLLESDIPPYRPEQSLGMDTNWILQVLMGTKSRNELVQNKLDEISDLIEKQKYKKAQLEIDRLRKAGLSGDAELLKLQTRLERVLILGSTKTKSK